MRIQSLLLLAATATVPVASHAFELGEGQVRIELRPQFIARDQEVRLGDVANLYTTDFPTIQRLNTLSLGRTPVAGREVTVRRDVIERWVRNQLGIGRDRLLWAGPEETHVRALAQDFLATRVEHAATTALRGWLDRRASRYSVDVLALPGDLKLPAGQVELRARPLAVNAEPTARMVVWMDVQVDGRFVRAVPVSFTVEVYREAWVAPTPIASGVALAPGMVEKREVPVTRAAPGLPAKVAQPGETAGAWRTTRAVRQGEPVTAQNAAPAPAIARGDWVELHFKSGLVELEGRAQALQDGELGQVVKVRSTGGASPVDARVVAPGRVEAIL